MNPETPNETVNQKNAPTANEQQGVQDVANAAQEAEPANEGGEFFDQLERLLDKLVPSSSVTITTATQGDITLPGAIPARQQVRVFRHMRDLLEMEEIGTAFASFSGQGDSSVADTVVGLATNEEVAEKLGVIFSAAYPEALNGNDPLDELPLEDLVAALSPFSQRFLKKLGGGITRMAKGANDLQS